MIFNGQKLKKEVYKANITKEQLIAEIQKRGVEFSYSGLNRMFASTLPSNSDEIIKELADVLNVPARVFYDSNQDSAA